MALQGGNTPENLRAKFRATKTLVVMLEIV